ncbi:CAP domain-containing protein [Neptunicoccus sediminis]|uniref:CAP domain-containing protein n=1 Tax=Neptunicoccus sediminis TaxID=1892596 RepID=UPI000845BF5A|nr:CAP domain-containing protein [Neptunicoccus sediminis]
MFRVAVTILSLLFAVSACTEVDPNQRQVFRISAGDVSKIQYRHLDAVNAVRQAQGLEAVQLSSQLNAAAKTHARDISRQNRPWHFGSDGSNPIQRVERAGYQGRMLSENISETFENDLETLDAWMRDPVTRAGILHPQARGLGFSWHQDSNGKIWWVQILGS